MTLFGVNPDKLKYGVCFYMPKRIELSCDICGNKDGIVRRFSLDRIDYTISSWENNKENYYLCFEHFLEIVFYLKKDLTYGEKISYGIIAGDSRITNEKNIKIYQRLKNKFNKKGNISDSSGFVYDLLSEDK